VPAGATTARRAVSTFARSCGFGAVDLADIECAAGEAVANAIEHGNRERDYFELHCEFDGTTLAIEVKDRGKGFSEVPAPRLDAAPRLRGWGIFLMRSLVDRVTFFEGGSGVRLEKKLPVVEDRGARLRAAPKKQG